MTFLSDSRLLDALADHPRRIIACSGGVDSLLLADVAHQAAPGTTLVAHSVTPAVPRAATERVRRTADALGWQLRLVESAELSDERYLANPVDRCFFCKTNLYDELARIAVSFGGDLAGAHDDWALMSGANVDDLGEYRPGLLAAAEHRVRHPFVEAGIGKAGIRALAAARARDWHDLPAAPCLASRLYTGTPVTPGLLRAVEEGEITTQRLTGLEVLRCRVRGSAVVVEVPAGDRASVTAAVLDEALAAMRTYAPGLTSIELDPEPYAPGRAFVPITRRPLSGF
jgi:uncharacterized protein